MGVRCPDCGSEEMDTEEDIAELAEDDEYSYFCVYCGGLFTEDEVNGS